MPDIIETYLSFLLAEGLTMNCKATQGQIQQDSAYLYYLR